MLELNYMTTQCVILDIKTLKATLLLNNQQIDVRFKHIDEFVEFCLRRLSPGTYVVLLGDIQTDQLYEKLKRLDLILCHDNIDSKVINKQEDKGQSTIKEVLDTVSEIKALLKQGQPKNAHYSLFSSPSPQGETKDIKELKSYLTNALDAINNQQAEIQYLISEIYNRESETPSNDSKIIDDLRNELSAYKNDFYQKSMLNFGVNTVIEILDCLYTEKNIIKQQKGISEELDRITQIILFCEAKIKKLNLKVHYSSEGDEFDGSRMINYDDKIYTENEHLKGLVAHSISPAIYWTLPRVNAPGVDSLLIKDEIVALYE